MYSAAVHLASVHLKIEDPIIAYKISSQFAKIALNLPDELFEALSIPKEFSESPEWENRVNRLVANQDRGFGFYILIKNYSDKFGHLNSNQISIENILTASNLPNEAKIHEIVLNKIETLNISTLKEGNSFDRLITDKIFFGNKFREKTGIAQQNNPGDLSAFIRDKPYLIFNSTLFEYEDLKLNNILEKIVYQQEITREEWFRFYTHCEKKIDEFDSICGI